MISSTLIFLLTFSSLTREIRSEKIGTIRSEEIGTVGLEEIGTIGLEEIGTIRSEGIGTSDKTVSSNGTSTETESDEEEFSVGKKTMQIGEVTFPIVVDVSVEGSVNESRVMTVNYRGMTRTNDSVNCRGMIRTDDSVNDSIRRRFLERSLCDFSMKEATFILAFLFMLLTFLLAGLFLCCASSKDETIPVAIAATGTSQSTKSCPALWNHGQSKQHFQPLAAQRGQAHERGTTPRRNVGSFFGDRF